MKPSRRNQLPSRAPVGAAASPLSPVAAGLGLFLAALAVRALHLWQIAGTPLTTVVMGDSKSYDAWGQTLAAGDWIGHEVFYQAPLYPYFLGVIYSIAGHDLFAARVAQSLLGAVAVVLIADAARRLFSPRAGAIAGAIAALYPTSVFFDGLIQKTALDGFLTAVALWIVSAILTTAATWRAWLALGVTIAALSLARENALALAAVLFVWSLLGAPGAVATAQRGVRVAPALAFVAGLALLLTPVAIRNYAVGGGFYLTTSQFGTNLYLGNNPRTDGTAGSLIAGRGSAEFERQDATDIAERAAGRPLTPSEVSSYWTAQTTAFIRAEPGHWIRLMARKTALLWNSYEAFDTESQESYAEYSWPLAALGWIGHFGVLVPLAFIGAWVTWRHRRRLAILYVMVAVYAASVILFFIYARYRYPLVPFLIVFAAAAIDDAGQSLKAWRRGHVTALATALLAVVVFTNWPLLDPGKTRAVTEHNLGAALQTEGNLDAAIEHYRRAITLDGRYAPAYSNLGAALAAKHDPDAAIEAYRRAIALAPDLGDAHFNLGNLLRARGDAAGAAREFQRALDVGGSALDVETNLGLALAEAGRTDEAIAALQRAVALSPQTSTTRYALGRLLLDARRPADAVEHLSIAAAGAGASAEVINDFGIALISLGRRDEAIAQFERAVARDPSSSEARNNLRAAQSERP